MQRLLLGALTAIFLGAFSVKAEDDDPPIVIIDDDLIDAGTVAPGAGSNDGASADDDQIIIIDDDDEPAQPPRDAPAVSGALGRLWETWHVAADSDLMGSVQLADPEDGPWRLLGSVWLESWLLPAPNLSVYANGFGRAAIDGTPTGRLVPIADLYEAYAKINADRAVVNIGRLVVPWGRTQGAALGDRVNPPDLRRGPPFPDAARQKQPMWGGTVRTSLGSLGLEGVLFTEYETSEGSLAASSQGGVRMARYQTALVRSPSRVGGLLADDDTSGLRRDPAFAASGALAGRAWRRIGDFDVSGSVVWGFDETPRLHLRPDVARALASELLAVRSSPIDDVTLSCADPASLECVGGRSSLNSTRTTSFSLDASWGLGVVIVRGEVLLYPKLGGLPGKTTVVADDLGLRTTQLSQLAAALAVEGSLGDLVDGSLELFDVVWDEAPAGALVWAVEGFEANVNEVRQVHRLAGAASFGGAVFEDRVRWRVRGEVGILAPDVLMSAEVRYRMPILGLYVGGRTDVFAGAAGTPGWFRQDGTLVGVFIGEGT